MTNRRPGVLALLGLWSTVLGFAPTQSIRADHVAAAAPAAASAHSPGAGTRPAPAGGFVWPLDPVPRVLRPFEAPPQPWAAGHRGVDLQGTSGQPVRAAGAGIVAFSGVIAGRGVVAIQHADGRRTTYEPLDQRAATGSVVEPGDHIGNLGLQGHCGDTPCLHWGLLIGKDEYRDPLTLLMIRQVRLLPLS